jgi:hypothetical protein
MAELTVGIAFIAGFVLQFSLQGIILLILTLSLTGIGFFKKLKYLIYISFALLGAVLIGNLTFIPFFPVGTVQGALLTLGSFPLKIIHNSGLIFIPLVANIIGLIILNKKSISK